MICPAHHKALSRRFSTREYNRPLSKMQRSEMTSNGGGKRMNTTS